MQENSIVEAMLRGYGKKFPSLETLFKQKATKEDIKKLLVPTLELSRYLKHVEFLWGVTSDMEYAKLRFRVMAKYFIALCDFVGKNQNKTSDMQFCVN